MTPKKQLRCLIFLQLLASHAVSAALPKVDFNRMGMVGLAGSFAGLDFFSNSSFKFDPSTSTLLTRAADGSLSPVASTNAGGQVSAGCALGDTFYLGGSFDTIGGVSARNVASYKTSSSSVSSVVEGLDGVVNSMYCDKSSGDVWVGGAFRRPVSASGSEAYKGAVAVFNSKGNTWSPPPFGGLAGAAGKVQSITPNPTGSSLYFTGSFLTAFQSNASPINPNNTNNPNVPFSIGATPYSSSLVPIFLASRGTEIDASPSSPLSVFSNISDILCPAGPDGPGNTWLAQDGSTARITVRTFEFSTSSGLRLGNTFLEGRGTTAFSVLTIPDNQPLTFNYVDPKTLRNETCSTSCPLSTDSSVPYQDFIFNGVSQSLTGVEITLSGWQGAGSGLHLLQLLSTGAFASAVTGQNGLSCFAPASSQTSTSGVWTSKEVTTTIAGTTQPILVSSVDVGTPSSSSPSVTWNAYVSASGNYDINLLIPGCTNLQDCDARTSVKVTVFPGGGLAPVVTTVSQVVTEDTSSGIYRGPIYPSGSNFQTTITLQLADRPTENGRDGKFELVADRVELVLVSVNITGGTAFGQNGTVDGAGVQRGFGFFEWQLGQSGGVDATGVIANSSKTVNDLFGQQLFSALGNNTSSDVPFVINAAASHHSGLVVVGGNFTLASGPTNIVAFKDNSIDPLSDGGLNGAVNALAISGDTLYVGGSFSDTSSGTGNGAFRGIVKYDVQNRKWDALLAGVNGAVADLNVAKGRVSISGEFTELPSTPNSTSGVPAGGFASWDIRQGSWINTGGFISGRLALVANGTGAASEFLAGSVTVSRQFGADGFVMLSNGDQQTGEPTVKPFSVQLTSDVSSATSTPQSRNKRRASWMDSVFPRIFARQASTKPAPLPALAPAPAPAILAGTFWTNTSDQVVILGGNFSLPLSGASQSQGLLFYDISTGSAVGAAGAQLNGTVRALQVSGQTLFVGGQFTLPGTQANGLALYDLGQQHWDNSFQPLQGPSVVVRSITVPPSKPTVVVVAGTFDAAGSLPCQGICLFDTASKQWNRLGQGINGEVSSVVYASNDEVIVAAGSIVLSDGTPANVAVYSLANDTWAGVGQGSQIPGPVTACEIDNGNVTSIFAAGSLSDGTSPFLTFWNGAAWKAVGSTFQAPTTISQLYMVPLQDTHPSNSMIESDRMLLISGSLISDSFGNVSSALYDGKNFFPYFVSTSVSGGPGFVSQLFRSLSKFSFAQHHILPLGVVILISIAIATGIVFLLLLIGILWTLFSRRDHIDGKYDPNEYDEDESLHRPSSLLEHINAATRGTIVGPEGEAPNSGYAKVDDARGAVGSPASDTFAGDHDAATPYIRATDTPVDATHGTLNADGETARPTYVRYSFVGEGEGELPVSAGSQILVLDDRDPAWWYARDPNTGREGVIPASYLY